MPSVTEKCPVRDAGALFDSHCPVRYIAAGVVGYSACMSLRVFLSMRNTKRNKDVKMPLHFNLYGLPGTWVTPCIGATVYPLLVLSEAGLVCHFVKECAKVTVGSKCPLAASQKIASQSLVAGVAVTLLAQYFATKIVLHNKTPAEVATANNASKEACHSGEATCYRIPPCLVAISIIACAVPTLVLAVCKK